MLRGRRSVEPGRTAQHARKDHDDLRFAKKSGRERSIDVAAVVGGWFEVAAAPKGRRLRRVPSAVGEKVAKAE